MKKSVSVLPSPYNPVKPLLVVALFLGAVLAIYVDKLTPSLLGQTLILLGFGLGMGLYVGLKIRNISKTLRNNCETLSK